MNRALCLAAIAACAVLLTACGESDPSASGADSVVLQGTEGRPDVRVPVGPAPKKLIVKDLAVGGGPPAQEGDELSVRYFNLAYDTHQIYEDSWSHPPPSFVLGAGDMVVAWEDGLPGIKRGGRRELVVPGGRSTFARRPEIYVVEALSIKPGKPLVSTPTRRVKGTGAKPTLHYPVRPPSHVVVRVLREGSGPSAKPGERLTARYIGGNAKTRQVQDFWSEESPYRFQLGGNRLGKAWEIGLKGMKLGGRRELIVPSRLAYGNGTMVYVIELLGMEAPERGQS